MPDTRELIDLSACRMVELLDAGEITPDIALDAVEERIAEVEPLVHALPTLCFDRARDHARRLCDLPLSERGMLRGLPVPIKDLTAVSGVRTTSGSRLLEKNISEQSGIVTETLEANGAIVYAKSNTPEFGTGGHTFNDVFETTCNPRNLSKSAGGSSGGAAAALACGTAWLAHGNDMAGSLRTPAGFCGVASLRPSPGLIATDPKNFPFQVLGQEGPMARSVEDIALMTDAMSGLSHRAGLSKPAPGGSYLNAAHQPVKPIKVAFSFGLGLVELSSVSRAAFRDAVQLLRKSGIDMQENHPDLSDADEAFSVLRALAYAAISVPISKIRAIFSSPRLSGTLKKVCRRQAMKSAAPSTLRDVSSKARQTSCRITMYSSVPRLPISLSRSKSAISGIPTACRSRNTMNGCASCI